MWRLQSGALAMATIGGDSGDSGGEAAAEVETEVGEGWWLVANTRVSSCPPPVFKPLVAMFFAPALVFFVFFERFDGTAVADIVLAMTRRLS